jgi:L-2,4-diaminobutyric acid acetyltransferase
MTLVEVRPAAPDDLRGVITIVQATALLDTHTPYTYWTVFSHSLMLIAECEGQAIGFVMGLRDAGDPQRAFLWQIGVAFNRQALGVGRKLLAGWNASLRAKAITAFTTTIATENDVSLALFRGFATRHCWAMRKSGETGAAHGVASSETIFTFLSAD